MGEPRLFAGAMSGTSADGVDVAIVRINGRGLSMRAELLGHHAHGYSRGLREKIFDVRRGVPVLLPDLAVLSREISLAYVEAIGAALAAGGLQAKEITAIAAHGQTLYHAPP